MNPDEDQLRAALHEGEPDEIELNAHHIISAAVADEARHRRSVRSAFAIAATVVIVAGGATGLITALGHDSSNRSSAGDAAAGTESVAGSTSAAASAGPSSAASMAGSAGSSAAASGGPAVPSTTGAASASCPTAPPTIAVPKPTAAGAAGALFGAGLISITVCVYQPDGSGLAAATTLTGTDATGLATTLNAIAPAPTQQACTADLGPTVLLLPQTTAGAGRPVVGNAGGCGTITNGTAERNARSELTGLIQKVLPGTNNSGRASPGPGPS
jgi:hypothetical protein